MAIMAIMAKFRESEANPGDAVCQTGLKLTLLGQENT